MPISDKSTQRPAIREQIKWLVVQWSFFEAGGRLYGRGATEAGEEDGGVRRRVHDVGGEPVGAGAGGAGERGGADGGRVPDAVLRLERAALLHALPARVSVPQ